MINIRMKAFWLVPAALLLAGGTLQAADNPLPRRERVIIDVRDGLFPSPAGVEELTIPNGNLETAGKPAAGWNMFRFAGTNPAEIISDTSKGALPPGTERYMRLPGKAGWTLIAPQFDVRGGRPHLLSLWVRSDIESGNGRMGHSGTEWSGAWSIVRLPATGGTWKRVGIYFRPTLGSSKTRLDIDLGQSEGTIDIADVRLRTATEDEFSAAYARWRAGYPAPLQIEQPEVGRNLALTVAKLKGEIGMPGRPFVIWGTGSSFTNFLLNGENLEVWRQYIRKNFPNAPEIVLKLSVGSGLPWQYCYGFVMQQGMPLQPDLVITYTMGKPEDLEKMLSHIRRYSTADIIVPSMHLGRNDSLDEKSIEGASFNLEAQREICNRYGAEFVENRRELGLWLAKAGRMPKEIIFTNDDTDQTHQNELGRLLISENITRHLAVNPQPSYDYTAREKRFRFFEMRKQTATPLKLAGEWKEENGLLTASAKGASLEMKFDGNRIDLIGRSLEGGGTAKVFIDGKPADQAPVFYTTAVLLTETTAPAEGRDQYWKHYFPHAAILGKNVVPQKWTIRMTDDAGNFELVGSVTGADGKGNWRTPFTSDSGQISLDPSLWRGATDARPADTVYMRQGDAWGFEVYRSSVASVSFAGAPGPLYQALVQNLPNGPHTLRLEADGNGKIAVDSLYVFTPPLK